MTSPEMILLIADCDPSEIKRPRKMLTPANTSDPLPGKRGNMSTNVNMYTKKRTR